MENRDIVTVGDKSANLSKVRLAQSVEIPSQRQKKVDDSSLLQGLVVTERKDDVMKRKGVRLMNYVHQVRPEIVLVSNFSHRPCRFQRGCSSPTSLGLPLLRSPSRSEPDKNYALCTTSSRPLSIQSPQRVDQTRITKRASICLMTRKRHPVGLLGRDERPLSHEVEAVPVGK